MTLYFRIRKSEKKVAGKPRTEDGLQIPKKTVFGSWVFGSSDIILVQAGIHDCLMINIPYYPHCRVNLSLCRRAAEAETDGGF